MSKNYLIVSITFWLSISLLAPTAFFAIPQRVHAQVPGVPTIEVNPLIVAPTGTTALKTTISAILDSLTQVNTFLTAAAGYANTINAYVLQPLAFVLSGNLMKMLTSSVIQFVLGKANGTGIPQFVVDLRKSMQTVSDSQALAYLRQVGLTSSPFSSSISSALRTDYLSKTSLKGFWEANLCTLAQSSQNAPAYVSGNWSQGGIRAWFSLTTETKNNPYSLYDTTRAGLANVIGPGVDGVTSARAQELAWGKGMMSWCSTSNAQQAGSGTPVDFAACRASGLSEADCTEASGGPTASLQGVNPGDACINKDGTSGTIKTPGSVISATLDKVLGGQQDQIARMGNIGPQINQALQSIATVVQTVNFAASLLGGTSGGLLAAGQTSISNTTSRIDAFTPAQDSSGNFTSGYIGATNSSIKNEADSAATAAKADATKASADAKSSATLESAASSVSALDMAARAELYKTSWSTIGSAASAAKANVLSLIDFCTKNPTAGQSSVTIIAAQNALTNLIQPIVNQATGASDIAVAAIAMDKKVKDELASGSSTYAADLQILQSMPPTVAETTSAQQNALSYGTAVASPAGSLNVLISSSVSTVTRMNLINTNATDLKVSACTPPVDYGGSGG